MQSHCTFNSVLLALLGAAALSLASCSGGGSAAGDGGGGGGGGNTRRSGLDKIGSVRVYNSSNHSGTSVAQTVIPLYDGGYEKIPDLVTDEGYTCQVHEMGPLYWDDTVRFLRIEFPFDAVAGELRTIKLATAQGSPPQFQKHRDVSGTIGVNARIKVGNTATAFPDAVLIEEGPITHVYRSRVRDPNTMVWAELTVSLYSHLPHAKFTLQWGVCHPGKPALAENPGQVEFHHSGATAEFEHAFKILGTGKSDGYQVAVLHKGGAIGDGQSQLVEGRFIYGNGGSPPRLFAMATNWDDAKAFGPLGEVIREVKINPQEFLDRIKDDESRAIDHPWAKPVHGCNSDPSNTGSQPDFGTIKMRPDVLLADPRRLPAITRSIYQEACRPTHFREVDVSPVTYEKHPNLLTLDGRPKASESTDLLGKPKSGTGFTTMKGPSGTRWRGHDPEHLSINYIGGLAMLTGNRYARELCDEHAMLYLTGFTHNSSSWNDSPGAARKIGRSSLAAIWIWMITGNEQVAVRLVQRTDDVARAVKSYNTNLVVTAPRGSYWVPWEEGIAMAGLAAVYRNFTTPSALAVLAPVCKTVTINGFGKLPDGQWRCGYHLPWYLGSTNYGPLRDPNFHKGRAAGYGLTMWAIPAVCIAAEVHPEKFTRDRATTILQSLFSGPTGGYEEHLDWVAVSRKVARLCGMTSQF